MITCNLSLSGIRELKISYETYAGVPIVFPLFPYINTSNNNVKVTESETNKTMTLAGVAYSYVDLTGNFQSFTEELVEDEKGRYYTYSLNVSNVFDVNMLELLNNKSVMVFIVDNNLQNWIIGYKLPLKLTNYTYNSGVGNDGQNSYKLVYTGKSYIKIKNYELI